MYAGEENDAQIKSEAEKVPWLQIKHSHSHFNFQQILLQLTQLLLAERGSEISYNYFF